MIKLGQTWVYIVKNKVILLNDCLLMYILSSDFFEKDDKYVSKGREFLAFKYVFIFFLQTYQMIIYICTLEI